MKSLRKFTEIYLHRAEVDGRKQINGLAAIVESEMGKCPTRGGLFVFTGRRRDSIRILYWDRTGFALWTKKLETEKFKWPAKMSADHTISLTHQQLAFLLDGYDIARMKPHQSLSYLAVS
ncbi:MAG: IS66 family insertion sequence element accessory protein TnpB [Proteobacteria bacterium]|nr:IS66 family insertion sequence element accessory protein TnpB [Pseudomonadota bacterium]